VVRDAPPGHAFHAREPETGLEALRGLWQVFTNRDFQRVLAVAFTNYPLVAAVLGLWGAPYLFDRYGMSPVDRGNVLLAMAAATITGFIVYGQLDRLLDTRKWLVVTGLTVSVGALLALGMVGTPPLWLTTMLFVLLGLFGSFNTVTLAHGRALFAPGWLGAWRRRSTWGSRAASG
jgi:predicted MFS family arabinose efflux permease